LLHSPSTTIDLTVTDRAEREAIKRRRSTVVAFECGIEVDGQPLVARQLGAVTAATLAGMAISL
jgi:hypothetical protein